MPLIFQPIENHDQWADAARLSNHYWPEEPVTAQQLIEYAKEHPPEKFVRRYVGTHDGEAIAYVRAIEGYWLSNVGRCMIGVAVERGPHAAAVFEEGLQFAIEEGRRHAMTAFSLWARSDDVEFIGVLETAGFHRLQTNPISMLDLAQFDGDCHASSCRQVEANGYEIMDLPTFEARCSDSWLSTYYDWDMAVTKDIPMSGQFEAIPIETYTKMMLNPSVDRAGFVLALKDGQVASATELKVNKVDPSLATTGLTGTRRDHRRQGLATAVKVTALEWGRARGVQRVFTDNEENNPMYGLNCALGFRRVRDMVEYGLGV